MLISCSVHLFSMQLVCWASQLILRSVPGLRRISGRRSKAWMPGDLHNDFPLAPSPIIVCVCVGVGVSLNVPVCV